MAVFRHQCPYCFYEWESGRVRPNRCPRCRRILREVFSLGLALPLLEDRQIQTPDFFECPHCGHKWRPRAPPRSRYRRCKKCGRGWTIGRRRMRCWECGHEWTPRREKPGRCPNCSARIFYPEGPAAEVLLDVLQGGREEGGIDPGGARHT